MLSVLEFVEGSTPEALVCLGGLVVYVLIIRLICFLLGLVTTTAATYEGDPETIKTRLRAIRERGQYRRELDALRCTDDNWQDCILAVLNEVDFVIIDNVDSSESIDWEIRNCSEKVGEERIFMLLGEQTETARDVTSVIFDFERAQLETSSLHGEWGADDFGENPPLGEYGRELAARIREAIISRSASSVGFSR